jgi:hypothetical protein
MAPNTKQLQALQRDIQPGGKLHNCIEAGSLRGSVSGEQATAMKEFLTAVLAQSIEQQATIQRLQQELHIEVDHREIQDSLIIPYR